MLTTHERRPARFNSGTPSVYILILKSICSDDKTKPVIGLHNKLTGNSIERVTGSISSTAWIRINTTVLKHLLSSASSPQALMPSPQKREILRSNRQT